MRKFKKSILMGIMLGVLLLAASGCDDTKENADTDGTSSEAVTEAVAVDEVQITEATSGDATENTVEATTENTTETTTQATTEATTETTTEAEVVSIDLFTDSGLSTFELSSENLHNGAWDSAISSVDNGLNVSPQLSWEPVPEAACYVIYMVDTSAGNWIHWKSNGVTETNLPQGWASEEEYIGPYPPGGTHSYDIYVFALRQPVERMQGAFNTRNSIFYNNAMKLDSVEEGSSGNIISYGYLPGTYTRED